MARRRARTPGAPDAANQRPSRRARPEPAQDPHTSTPPDARDALQDIWWRHRDHDTNTALIEPTDPVMAAHLAAGTWTRTSINAAVDDLVRGGVVARIQPNAGPEDTRGRVRILPTTAPSLAPTAITITVNETGQPNPDR